MRFHKLYVRNFLSIQEAEINLDRNGVTLIGGPNGAGKSSLISESLLWCLYGVTARGIDGDEVINQDARSNCLVSISFTTDEGTLVEVSRSRGPNMLQLVVAGKDVTCGTMKQTQEQIEHIMGLGATSFINSILCAQGKVAGILNMTDKEAKAVLDDILDTERFAKAQDVARSRLKQAEADVEYHKGEILNCQRAKDAAEAHITSIKDALSTWDEEQKRTVDAIHERLATLKCEISEAADNILILEEEMAQYEQYPALLVEYRSVRGYGDSNFKNAEETAQRLERMEEQVTKKREAMNRITANKVCPTCGQQLKSKDAEMHLAIERAKAEEEIDGLVKEMEYLEKKLADYIPKLEALDEKLGGLKEADLVDKSQEYEIRKRRVADLRSTIKVKEEQEDRLRSDLRKAQEGQGAMDALRNRLADQEAKLEKAKQDEVEHHAALGTAATEVERLRFWVDAFGPAGIRSRILDSVLPYINERLDFYSRRLTGGDIQIRFETQNQTKGGKVKDQFHIEVNNMNGGDTYEKQSGGEKKRIGLCVVMALHDLVRNRYGKTFNIAVYDEIFDELDEDGVESAIGLINQAGREKSIFVISHNAAVKSSIENHIEVKKQGRMTVVN